MLNMKKLFDSVEQEYPLSEEKAKAVYQKILDDMAAGKTGGGETISLTPLPSERKEQV